MPLKSLIALLGVVVLAAAVTVAVAFWFAGSLPGAGAAVAWVLPLAMGAALAVRFMIGRRDDS